VDTFLKVVYSILVFDAIIVAIILVHYLTIGRHQKIPVDFEEYLQDLPRNTVILDPYILVDGKWVNRNKPPPNPLP
jgi:hypothetical protein